MKRFHYRLESLLRLKRQLKRLAELDQIEAKRHLDTAEAQLRSWEQELDAAAAELSQRLGVLGPAREYLGRQDLVQAVQREIEAARQHRADAQKAWQQAHERFSRLAVQEEMLQTYRSRQWQEHHHEQESAALGQMDDFVMRQWAAGCRVPEGETQS